MQSPRQIQASDPASPAALARRVAALEAEVRRMQLGPIASLIPSTDNPRGVSIRWDATNMKLVVDGNVV